MPKAKKITARLRRKHKIRAKINGTATRPRLVVYRSNSYISAQLVDDETGVTLASANDLSEKKGTKTDHATKVGDLIAKTAQSKKIETCVFDRNGYSYHGRVKALADAARAGGLKF